ncbi:pyrroloquinoline quinone biosynthesis protein PqqB [Oceanibaculum pacificum]|uniref:Coenzyme PQQ synthesis protein B n=1 Tax=Oceanibaculum pacificum TaxID=580166 RepID=A0A154WEP0_9PROT|nr:pyrroloquinoline quinone biosynthesis protein PqqB [Oceanibaculum pacificum]KZD11970.1 pyrroloquinoline quinone biosynthesis protein B [Oceanibaculum pacificum]
MHVLILGAAAGGGFPQWNCRCPNCRLYWAGDPRARARSQASAAFSLDGEKWLVLGASPDIRQQILDNPALHPRGADRHTPIAAIGLLNGDIDHVGGLLTLRERQALELIGTQTTQEALAASPIFSALNPDFVLRRAVALEESVETAAGLMLRLFAVPGKVPLWQEGQDVEIGGLGEATVGALIEGGGRRAYYIPSCAAATEALLAELDGADLLLFDGTCWEDDEMIRLGLGPKTAHRMGHLSMNGPQGAIVGLASARIGQRVFIHINNSNPVLIDGAPERGVAEAAGWRIAEDGMEIEL